jgi:sulfite reductase alpha subunit-like flavoprotein
VVFGNRNRRRDYLYEDEWDELLRCGAVSQILTAFSRDQESKVYVQHRMAEEAEKIWKMLNQEGGIIYVAGNKDLPGAISNALETIAVSQGGMSNEDASQFVKLLVRTGRLQVECWS